MAARAPFSKASPRTLRRIAALPLLLGLALGLAPPAGATLDQITIVPPQPRTCDPVVIRVDGTLPGDCYGIVGATIRGPEEIPCLRPGPCPRAFDIEITVREPDPRLEIVCTTVITPYQRRFDVGKLLSGEYLVRVVERIVPAYPGPIDSVIHESRLSAPFTVLEDSTCVPGDGCYILSFTPDPPDSEVVPFCTAVARPGGSACLDLSMLNSKPVAGVQLAVDIQSASGGSADPFLRIASVEAVGRAQGFQVGFTGDGARTRIILYSPSGASIPLGTGPIMKLCYAVAPETPPDVFFVRTSDEIVADPLGNSMIPCPTFDRIAPGRICVGVRDCDVNGDGHSDVLDVIRIVRCALAPDSVEVCPPEIRARADCTGDGSVDIRDVICCVRKILGLGFGAIPAEPLPVGTGENAIGFAGQIRWVNDLEGVATVEIKTQSDWGGSQFSLDPSGAPVRVRELRLLENPASARMEWAVDGVGAAHAMIFSPAPGAAEAEATLRVEVLIERIPGAFSGGTLRLAGIRSGTASGAGAPTASPNPALAIPASSAGAPMLLGARPNPFARSTEIAYAVPAPSRVVLRLYDVAGRLVRTLVDGPVPSGVHRVAWDGSDARGRSAPAGIYFAELQVGRVTRTDRLLLLR